MRIDFGKQTWMIPMPVLIIGTYDENGTPDAMNAAWGGIHDYNEICICLSSSHKTAKNILLNKEFTVAFADCSHIAQADYLGIVSANDFPDKFTKSGLTVEKSNYINAPVIKELPMSLDCRLISYDEKKGFLVGEIINVSADENIVTDGKIDMSKFNPAVFETFGNTYMSLGNKIADAFSVGNTIIADK